MTREERLAMIEKLQADNAATLADMSARYERQLQGVEPFDDEPTPQPQEQRMVFKTREPDPPRRDDQWADWNRWADGKIKAALEQQREFLMQVFARAIAEERSRMRQHVAEKLGELRVDLEIEKKSAVIDLPQPPMRRRDAA
jgi:hypothetical protein